MGLQQSSAMARIAIPLATALALLLVAVGGAAAADAPGTTTPAVDAPDPGDTPTADGDVGICVVGADSPCNGPAAENGTSNTTHPTPVNDPTEIDDGDGTIVDDGDDAAENDSDADAGICLVGADTPCNDGGDRTDDGTAGEEIGSDDGSDDSQIWLPEDQNRDGQIDDRFGGADGGIGALVAFALSLAGVP